MHSQITRFGFVLGVVCIGCGADALPADTLASTLGTTSIYRLPATTQELSGLAFFDQPWPSDLRTDSGVPVFKGYVNPYGLPLLDDYIESTKGLGKGFSPAAAGFLRFSGPLDVSSLPADPKAAVNAASSVQLIDIDPSSPERGQRKLISLHFQQQRGVYWPENTLAFMPTHGFPLRVGTRYALVVTTAARDSAGRALEQSETIGALLGRSDGGTELAAARDALAPAVADLVRAGVDRATIAHFAVFTTSDPTEELYSVCDDAKTVEAPTFRPGTLGGLPGVEFDEYVGTYGPSPNYQEGKIPFATAADGGGFKYENGKPTPNDLFDLRFSLSVPKPDACPMPEHGYPVVLYAHGTGGDYRSYIGDGTARSLTEQCLAVMGVDQIFHGTRPGGGAGNEEILFYNFQNVVAARTNARQSAVDEVQRARLFTESHVEIPAEVAVDGHPVKFDAQNLTYFGHSQGGQNGPLYLACDNSARGGVLSASGGAMSITLLEKTSPEPSVAALVRTIFLGLTEKTGAELNSFHPAISLAQTLVDVVDPIHYARNIIAEPRAGSHAKSVYMTEGVNSDGTGDTYAPPHGIEAHALAMGLPLSLPMQKQIVELAFGGPTPVSIPASGIRGNLGGGEASGILTQWAVPPGIDGHFVVFHVPQATLQAARFVKNLAADPVGMVPPIE